MSDELAFNQDYKSWLKELKLSFRSRQIKASLKVNQELLFFYWDLGVGILEKQEKVEWGQGLIRQLSLDLKREFPDVKGFSERNLKYVRQWVQFFIPTIGQQAVAQLEEQSQRHLSVISQVPWGHNIAIISKCETPKIAQFYLQKVIENGWSRVVLTHQIESGLWEREGAAISNFQTTLPEPQSELAQQCLKDPYQFDFLNLTEDVHERELELKLIEHITQFLMELGSGFAYMGRQFKLMVGKRDFYLDLLFYHTQLHCYVVIELKTVEFEPEHAGKLNFYLKAVDEQLKGEHDAPSIGILLCKGHDHVVVEYALSNIDNPIGVSEYQLTKALPEKLKTSLPSIEEIENELKDLDL
jgi:predicted nuclease of restriction endonuclease-like (RecB) superfamily